MKKYPTNEKGGKKERNLITGNTDELRKTIPGKKHEQRRKIK